MRVARAVKRVADPLLPRGAAARTIPFGPLRGLRMEIDLSTRARLYLGVFEIELVRWFRAFCRNGSSSFDAGAREGYMALLFARLSAGGRVLAVEADPRSVRAPPPQHGAEPDAATRPEPRLARITGRTAGTGT